METNQSNSGYYHEASLNAEAHIPHSDQYFADIHAKFSQTPYGQDLARGLRYDRYKPLEISNEEWEAMLGPDVNNLKHMEVTFDLAVAYLDTSERAQPGMYSPEEAELIKAAAISHDWAEAITTDITFSKKTAADTEHEARIFEQYLPEFYNGPAADLILEAAQKISFNEDRTDKLAVAFNAVERIGYMETALKAMNYFESDVPQSWSYWLVADVLKNQIPTLGQYSAQLPAVKAYLSDNQLLIGAALSQADRFGFHPQDDQAAARQAYDDAVFAWHGWLDRNTTIL